MSTQVDFIGHIGKRRYALVEDGQAWLYEECPLKGQRLTINTIKLTTAEVATLLAAMTDTHSMSDLDLELKNADLCPTCNEHHEDCLCPGIGAGSYLK